MTSVRGHTIQSTDTSRSGVGNHASSSRAQRPISGSGHITQSETLSFVQRHVTSFCLAIGTYCGPEATLQSRRNSSVYKFPQGRPSVTSLASLHLVLDRFCPPPRPPGRIFSIAQKRQQMSPRNFQSFLASFWRLSSKFQKHSSRHC